MGGSEASGKPKEEECTMNLARIERATVLHQFGHALGLEHEHQHPTAPLEWNQEKVQLSEKLLLLFQSNCLTK